MGVIFVAGLLALVEEVNTLSVIVGLLATAMFANVLTAPEARSWQRHLFDSATIPFRGPFQLIGEVTGALRHMKPWTPEWPGSLVAWIVPLSVFTLFLALFASANPLIENRLLKINFQAFYNLLDVWRIWFWALIACAIWPLLRRRIRRKPASFEFEPRAMAAAASSDMDYLLGVQAVTRSLVVFNALFALQSGLDLTYLWGGASLPDGMTLAEYAHRGAYPLIATALLCLLIIVSGLALRGFGFGFSFGLSAFVVKYGGSALWATMVYFLVAMVASRASRLSIALISAAIGVGVELFRLIHAPWLDAFRLTLPGALLLGRILSPWNMLAYGAGIVLAIGFDRMAMRAFALSSHSAS